VNDKLERIAGLQSGKIWVLPGHFPGGTDENQEKPVTMSGVSAEIRKEHLLKISLG
jgi:hypothetical protein